MNYKSYLLSFACALFLSVSCNQEQDYSKQDQQVLRSLRHKFAAGEITRACDEGITQYQLKLDRIKGLAVGERTTENTLLAFEKAGADFYDVLQPLAFMKYVSQDEGLRKEGGDCELKYSNTVVDIMTSRELYEAIKDADTRSDVEERLLEVTLKSFEKNGLKLNDNELAQVKKLKQKLEELQNQFSTNLNEDVSSVAFTREELEGASQDFLDGLKKDAEGKYKVTTKSNSYIHVMENVKSSETRKALHFAYENRAPANTALLEEAITTRQQIAQALGYKTWADYQLDGRMAESSEKVLTFLNSLKDRLSSQLQVDLQKMYTYKKEVEPQAQDVAIWDVRYLNNQLKKRDYSIDDEAIREYFPADVVMAGLFEVYSKILGVEYQIVNDIEPWAPEVKLYRILNKSNHNLIGYFFADFVPRDGKYGHAAAFTLITGRLLDNGQYSVPVSSIVSNFTPPSNGKPSLLTHDEVETLFHEFGHIMHQTLTKAPFATISGSNTSQDFVEAPSQMLENWVWNSDILEMISGHYQDHAKKLPKELLEKMLAARTFNNSYFYTRQLVFGLFDMTIHSQNEKVDVTDTYNKIHLDLVGIPAIEGGHFAASFGHMMGGYDAGYYGYLWSEVYAQDMFTRFEKDGLLNSNVGSDYRKIILEKGNSKLAIDLLKQFLGREPNNDAFYKKIGI